MTPWKTASILFCCGLLPCFVGCKAREMGVQFSGKQAVSVNNTWIIAASSCWPDLTHQGYTLAGIKHYLGDPLHFRATFGVYAGLSDAQLLQIIPQPVSAAPPPDTSVLNQTLNPILTRTDAVTRKNLKGVLAADNNGIAPPDALCAVQHGLPVGFR